MSFNVRIKSTGEIGEVLPEGMYTDLSKKSAYLVKLSSTKESDGSITVHIKEIPTSDLEVISE